MALSNDFSALRDAAATANDAADAAKAAHAAHTSVLLVPVPPHERAAVLVTGKDRTTWLNGLVTCELANLGPNEGAYGLFVEKKGRIQTDLWVLPGRSSGANSGANVDSLALALPTALRADLVAKLDHFLIMEDAEMALADLVFFAAHGPLASRLVSLAPFAGTVDVLGSGGAFFAAPVAEADALEAALGEAVKALGGYVASDAATAYESLRIAQGVPRFGMDFDATFYPQEASLETRAVSFTKGCYLGQEVVYMLENRGHVKRKLVVVDFDDAEGLSAASAAIPPVGAVVMSSSSSSESELVGHVTSATFGHRLGHGVALALVKWAHSKPGVRLVIDGAVATVRG